MEKTVIKNAAARQKPMGKKKRKAIVLTETQEILADPETMAALRRGISRSQRGKKHSFGTGKGGTRIVTYQIELTPTARDALAAVTDKRIQRNIYNRLLRLENNPDKQGRTSCE